MKSKEWENKNRELAARGQSKSRNGIPFTVKRGGGRALCGGVAFGLTFRLGFVESN